MNIEIITRDIDMPNISDRRFKRKCINNNESGIWYIYDTEKPDKVISKGSYDDMTFGCYFMNKKYYDSKSTLELLQLTPDQIEDYLKNI